VDVKLIVIVSTVKNMTKWTAAKLEVSGYEQWEVQEVPA